MEVLSQESPFSQSLDFIFTLFTERLNSVFSSLIVRVDDLCAAHDRERKQFLLLLLPLLLCVSSVVLGAKNVCWFRTFGVDEPSLPAFSFVFPLVGASLGGRKPRSPTL